VIEEGKSQIVFGSNIDLDEYLKPGYLVQTFDEIRVITAIRTV
jgi:hypothetical protein